MWGSCRGRLTPHYSEVVLCSIHKEEETLEHVGSSHHLVALPDVRTYKTLIENKRFDDWGAQEQLDASLAFAALHIKVQQLLDLEVLRKAQRTKEPGRKSTIRNASTSSMRTTLSSSSASSVRTISSQKKTVRFTPDADSPMAETEQSPIKL